jgi:hypothetical protein
MTSQSSQSGNLKPQLSAKRKSGNLNPQPYAKREIIELDGGVGPRDVISFEITKCRCCKAQLINGVSHNCSLANDLFGGDVIASNADQGYQFETTPAVKRPASPQLFNIGSGYENNFFNE